MFVCFFSTFYISSVEVGEEQKEFVFPFTINCYLGLYTATQILYADMISVAENEHWYT